MKAARLAWFEGQPDLDPDRLVYFLQGVVKKKDMRYTAVTFQSAASSTLAAKLSFDY